MKDFKCSSGGYYQILCQPISVIWSRIGKGEVLHLLSALHNFKDCCFIRAKSFGGKWGLRLDSLCFD